MELNKIYQGDCLDLMSLIDDKSIDMILCDLPYGTTACKWDTIIPFELLWLQYKRIIKDNGAIVLTASQPFTTDLINSNRKWFRYELIWNKVIGKNFLLANKMPIKCHENICIFYSGLPIYNPQKTELKDIQTIKRDKRNVFTRYKSNHYGSIKPIRGSNKDIYKFPTSVIKFKVQNISNQFKSLKYHDTQKPVKLFEYLIKTYTNKNDLVLDNCIGSGTTAIACMQTDRNYIGMELEEKYIEIANKRIKEHKQQLVLV